MKKIILLFILIISINFTNNSFGQQVNKKYVVVEIGTGTWCPYCPGAAMGADDLIENGHSVAVIENHNGDSYTNTFSNSRNSLYGINSFPTAVFNGKEKLVGGSHTQSLYSSYLPIYNNAVSVMSDFTLDLSYTHSGSDYDVTVNIDETGDYAGTNLAVYLVLTESHLAQNWQGQTELNFVNKAMYPDQNGTSFSGGTQSLNLSFTADSNWDLSNCELVAFIQDKDTKEILQADKAFLAEPSNINDVEISEINDINDICDGYISPSLIIKNLGSSDVTSLTINYDINNGSNIGTINWSGDPVEFYNYTKIDLNEISFSLQASNIINLEITQVNGNTDEDTGNNSGSVEFFQAPETNNVIHMELHTDAYGNECTWDIKNSSGTVLFSGGPYGNNQTVYEQFYLDIDCNSFNIYDAYGDGGGAITLTDNNGTVCYLTNGSYGSGESQKIKVVSYAEPVVSFSPENGDTNVDIKTDIILSFNQPMRMRNNSEITNLNVSNIVILTDTSEQEIPFTGSINDKKTVITLNPDNDLTALTDFTVTVLGDNIESIHDLVLSESSATFATGTPTGILKVNNKIRISPNPANDYINISGVNSGNIFISDISGKQIISQEISETGKKINIRGFKPGIYFIRIISENNIVTKKFIKK